MALKLDRSISASFPPSANVSQPFGWETLHNGSTGPMLDFAPSTWVQLFKPPTAFAYDEAWLLCQCSEDQWLAWIPDYGEILLNTRDFCSLRNES